MAAQPQPQPQLSSACNNNSRNDDDAMHATRLVRGVRGIFPFLRDVAPATLRPVPPSRLSGLTLAIDATLISTRFHFADDPHPARHLFGFYRLIRALRALDARAIMVFDHPLGGNRARNPAKLQEAERRRTQRALVTKRAMLEARRFARIQKLSELIPKYERLSAQEAGMLHDQLRTAYSNRELMRERAKDVDFEDDEESDLRADSMPAEVVGAHEDLRDRRDLIEVPGTGTSGGAEPVQAPEHSWDELVGTPIWDELQVVEQIASASLSTSMELLEKTLLPTQPADEVGTLPAHIAELVNEFHKARLQFESLHSTQREDSAAPRSNEDSVVESKNQIALTAAEARIHETMLNRGAPSVSLGQLHREAAIADDEDEAGDGDGAEAAEDGTEPPAPVAVVPRVLESDMLEEAEKGLKSDTPEEDQPRDTTVNAPLQDKLMPPQGFELHYMHTQSTALSKSYHRASKPLSPQTIIDCAYLCALMGVPVLFTSRGTDGSTTTNDDDSPTLTIPGAAWAGQARLRSRAHEAEALAASLVHAGFAQVVASEDSDVLMYDVPMLRGLTSGNVGGTGGQAGLKGLVWVDAKEVRRALFGISGDAGAEVGQGDEAEQHRSEGGVNVDGAAGPLTKELSASLSATSERASGSGHEEDLLAVDDDDIASEEEFSTLAQDHAPGSENEGDVHRTNTSRTKTLTPDEENRRLFLEFALLLGTDFNRTIPGVGPKSAHSLMKEHKSIPAILRLKRPPPKSASAKKPRAPSKAVPTLAARGADLKWQPPPPLTRREYLIELARARNVFNRPPTLYGNFARLRRWVAGGEYFDWRGCVSEEEKPSEGDAGSGKVSEQQRRQELVRKEDEWRRGEMSRLFQKHGVRRLPPAEAERGFGRSLENFVDELGNSQADQKEPGAPADAVDAGLATSGDTTSDRFVKPDPFGSDVFGERDVPSGLQAAELLVKTAPLDSPAGRPASRRISTSDELDALLAELDDIDDRDLLAQLDKSDAMVLPNGDDGARLQDNSFEEITGEDVVPLAPPPSSASALSWAGAGHRRAPSQGTPRTHINTAPISSFFPRASAVAPPNGGDIANRNSLHRGSSSGSSSRASSASSSRTPDPAAFFKTPATISMPSSTNANTSSSRLSALSHLGGSRPNSGPAAGPVGGSSGSGRQLPANILAAPHNRSASDSKPKGLSVLQPRHLRPNPLQQPIAGSSRASAGGIPVIDGSTARTPSAYLPGQQRPPSSVLGPLPSIPRVKPEQLQQQMSGSHATAPANGVRNGKGKQEPIDLTYSDDDEPKFVSATKTEPEITIDASRTVIQNEQIVCIGVIRAGISIASGTSVPYHMVSLDGSGRNFFDELYDSDHWPAMGTMPRGSAFWTEPGYRPVHVDINHRPVQTIATGRFIDDQWEMIEQVGRTPEGRVLTVLSPAHVQRDAHLQMPRGSPQPPLTGPRIVESFGTLYERPSVLLANLQFTGKCGLEARIRVIPRVHAFSQFQQIEVNVFVPKSRAVNVILSFRMGGLMFERPGSYDPTDYPSHPPLVTDHLQAPNFSVGPAIFTMPGVGVGSSISYAPVDNQEEARKQVDQVYTALRAGEDLPTTEAGRLLKTKLFPHQKQALSFLLDREKARSWEEGSEDEDEEDMPGRKGKGKRGSKTLQRAKTKTGQSDDDEDESEDKSGKGKGKGKDKEKEDGKKEPRVVSLWKAEKSSRSGAIVQYTNVVTNQKQKHRPQVCRGAILADDMGLGKTISIIALMTRTWSAAEEFGETDVTTLADVDLPEDDDDEDVGDSMSWMGGARARPGRKKGKKEKKWREQERARITNLKKRSRATLIVCPMTVISNWIEQINEHWVGKEKPKLYTYHGPGRNQTINFLANHDVILTTYSTLAYEFGRSTTWADEDEVDAALADMQGIKLGSAAAQSTSNQQAAQSDDDDDEFEMFDKNGNKLAGGSNGKGKAGVKRKKAVRKEAFNPLQRIEFFRIVLDESHMIKETSTLQSKAVCNLSAQRRISLTGTPIQNKLDDLYSQFKFLRLDPFHKKTVWTKFCMHNSRISLRNRKEAQAVDSIGLARIQTIMKAVALRRTKESKDAKGEPILKLPPKASRIVTLEFDEHERAKYEAMRHSYKEDFEQMVKSDSVGKNYASILVEINALRLTCDDATLVDFGKDMKRLKEGRDDLVAAIREDGLSVDRAAQLFKVFTDCDQGTCYDCERDLSGKLEAEDEDLEDEAPKKRANKKARTTKGLNGLSTGDGDAAVNPVVTRCQHLFCSDCFARKLGPAWANPKADTKAPCPQCNESLTVTLDAIELDHDMLQESSKASKRRGKYDSDSETQSDTESEDEDRDFSDMDLDDGEKKEKSKGAWRPKRGAALQRLKDEDEEEEEEEQKKGDKDDEDKKPAARPNGESSEDKKNKNTMSSKIRALLAELEPFSRCNPASQLYDRTAPRLAHYAPTPPKPEENAKEADDMKPAGATSEGAGGEAGSSSELAPAAPAFEPVQVISLPPLSELDDDAAEEARKADPVKSVVFSQWTRMLDRIGKALEKKGIRYARLDGTMTRVQRSKALEQFKLDPKFEVLLISLRAGGFGLNLVSACRAYLIDPYWNPAVENQGLDRIYRLGQRRPVVLTRFIMKKSIEENMLELQRRKMELAEQVGKRRGPQSAAERREERERDLRTLLR
ncbi:hypothetical protein A4X06_0g4189 [Tilletia controversa]|uniref:Uncharacterized protein n=1 Tax=Tilletia controversa TaxID=13291 RepID=A0A8X7SWW5_9BASI|nr:hypothetical protein A4X06_0g4189 [Tilletia controversa]